MYNLFIPTHLREVIVKTFYFAKLALSQVGSLLSCCTSNILLTDATEIPTSLSPDSYVKHKDLQLIKVDVANLCLELKNLLPRNLDNSFKQSDVRIMAEIDNFLLSVHKSEHYREIRSLTMEFNRDLTEYGYKLITNIDKIKIAE